MATSGRCASFVVVGASAASIFVLPAIFRGEYDLTHYLSFRPHARRAFTYWNITFVALLTLAFVTRALEDYSRASMILFYLAGLPAVVLTRYALVSTVMLGSKVGLVTAQRVFLIGSGEDICGVRAALSAVEFRAAHRRRRAADAARLVRHARGAAPGARSRSAPARSIPRACCGRTRSIS